jgi:hypothetical protein
MFTSGGTMKRLNKFPDIERWLGNIPIAERIVIRHRKTKKSRAAISPPGLALF